MPRLATDESPDGIGRDAEDAMNESLKHRALARLSSSMGADPDGDLIRELYEVAEAQGKVVEAAKSLCQCDNLGSACPSCSQRELCNALKALSGRE